MKHEILQELGFILWINKTNFLSHAQSMQSDVKYVCLLGKI